MGKKNKASACIFTGIAVICVFIFSILWWGNVKSRTFAGKLFEDSYWQLTWEDLYDVCESAKAFDVNNQIPQVTIWYGNRDAFNADVEGILKYLMLRCEKNFYYGTRGDNPADYISKPQNTGTYEEELSWVSMLGECLSVRCVRIGSGADALMKIIIENEPLEFLDGEVMKSDNVDLIVKLGAENVRLSWRYVTGKRYISETTPLYQVGDKVSIGILKAEEIQYYYGNEYGTLGMKYLEKH